MSKREQPIVCDFCGKTQEQVKKIIVSTTGAAAICDECVDLCVEVCRE